MNKNPVECFRTNLCGLGTNFQNIQNPLLTGNLLMLRYVSVITSHTLSLLTMDHSMMLFIGRFSDFMIVFQASKIAFSHSINQFLDLG